MAAQSKVFQKSFEFLQKHQKPSEKLSLSIICNFRPPSTEIMRSIVQNSHKIICADGGANHYLEFMRKNKNAPLPAAIVGDLDSLKQETADYFRAEGVKIIEDQSQDKNDFSKALDYIKNSLVPSNETPLKFLLTNRFLRYDHFL